MIINVMAKKYTFAVILFFLVLLFFISSDVEVKFSDPTKAFVILCAGMISHRKKFSQIKRGIKILIMNE